MQTDTKLSENLNELFKDIKDPDFQSNKPTISLQKLRDYYKLDDISMVALYNYWNILENFKDTCCNLN